MQLIEGVFDSCCRQRAVANEAFRSVRLELRNPVVVHLETRQAQPSIRAQLDPVPHRGYTIEDDLGIGLVLEDLLDPCSWVVRAGEHVLVSDPAVLDLLEAVNQGRPIEAGGRL